MTVLIQVVVQVGILILMVASVKIALFCIVALYSLIEVALMMEAASTSESLVDFYLNAQC
jgi:hypothetical protein